MTNIRYTMDFHSLILSFSFSFFFIYHPQRKTVSLQRNHYFGFFFIKPSFDYLGFEFCCRFHSPDLLCGFMPYVQC
ncbi:hypothetical protein DERF_002857 [Dermatophagoides farinae]|uniref:Uncharacterized protein n=1 Tax=Dermatophagoides farinae TaxID=6954 RepID=A0A922IGS6_DERFA|nr:hypothetical protein DERF_002857 [Dermatophagoides farinae]